MTTYAPGIGPTLTDHAFDNARAREDGIAHLADLLVDGVCPWQTLQDAYDGAVDALSPLPPRRVALADWVADSYYDAYMADSAGRCVEALVP